MLDRRGGFNYNQVFCAPGSFLFFTSPYAQPLLHNICALYQLCNRERLRSTENDGCQSSKECPGPEGAGFFRHL